MFSRTHPITIAANLQRFWYLIVIPVARGFFTALRGGFALWVRGAWVDILILLLMLALAVLRWWLTRYRVQGGVLELHSGFLLRQKTSIPICRICTLSVVNSFYLKPVRAVYFRADTLGGSRHGADLTLLLHTKRAEALLDQLSHGLETPKEPAPSHLYIPRTRSVLAQALLTSNSFAGIVFVSTFISQAGRLLGQGFAQQVVDTFAHTARMLAFGIPPAAAAIAYALLFGWLVGFATTFSRYKNFSLLRRSALHIQGGIFTNRLYAIRSSGIYDLEIRHSLISQLFNVYSLYICVAGYGKYKNDIGCIVPAERKKRFEAEVEKLFPGMVPAEPAVRPVLTGVVRFVWQPLLLCFLIPLAMIAIDHFLPDWTSFIGFVGSMCLIPSGLFLAVRLLDFRTSGLAHSGDFYTIRYGKGFYLRTVMIKDHHIANIQVTQNPFQRRKDLCDCTIYAVAEGRRTHRCCNLPRQEVLALLKQQQAAG